MRLRDVTVGVVPYSAVELRLPERRTTVPIADACDEGAARGAAPQRCKRRSAAIGVYGGVTIHGLMVTAKWATAISGLIPDKE